MRPGYWTNQPGGVVAATNADLLLPFVAGAGVSNTPAIDFVLTGRHLDPTTSLIPGIRRIPPAHRLLTGATPTLERTGSLPPTTPRHRPPAKLVAEFWDLFVAAVADRAVGSRAAVMLSGGLDSAAMLVALAEVLGPKNVVGATYGRPDDEETAYAQDTAHFVGVNHVVMDGAMRDCRSWPDATAVPVYPIDAGTRQLAEVAGEDPVFYGLGGDLTLRGDRDHWPMRLRRRQLGIAMNELYQTVFVHGRRPGVRAAFKRTEPAPPAERFAPPLRGSALHQASLRLSEATQLESNCRRGIDQLNAPGLPMVFELAAAGSNLTFTAPFLDMRLVEFAATVSSAPWFVDKEILRAALRGRVPDRVRLRPKAPAVARPPAPLDSNTRELLCRTFERPSPAEEFIDADGCRTLAVQNDASHHLLLLMRAAAVWRVGAELASRSSN